MSEDINLLTESHRSLFKAVLVFVLIGLSFLFVFDAPATYRRYVVRCENQPELKECEPLNLTRPAASPVEGLLLDQGSGRWAILLSPMSEPDASAMFDQLKTKGVTARKIRVGSKRSVRIQLQLGRFKTKTDATNTGTELKNRSVLTNFVIGEYRSGS